MKKSSHSHQDFESAEIGLFEESFSLKNSVKSKLIKLSSIAKTLKEDLIKQSNSWQREREFLSTELNELKTKLSSIEKEYQQFTISSEAKVLNLEQDLSTKRILLRDTTTELKETKESLLTAENLNSDLITLVNSLKEENHQKTIEFSRQISIIEEELKHSKVEFKIAINDLDKNLQEKQYLESQNQKLRENSEFLSKKLSDTESLLNTLEHEARQKISTLEIELASLKGSDEQKNEKILFLQSKVFQAEGKINTIESEGIVLRVKNDELLRKLESGYFLSFEERSILHNQLKMVLETLADELDEIEPEE